MSVLAIYPVSTLCIHAKEDFNKISQQLLKYNQNANKKGQDLSKVCFVASLFLETGIRGLFLVVCKICGLIVMHLWIYSLYLYIFIALCHFLRIKGVVTKSGQSLLFFTVFFIGGLP